MRLLLLMTQNVCAVLTVDRSYHLFICSVPVGSTVTSMPQHHVSDREEQLVTELQRLVYEEQQMKLFGERLACFVEPSENLTEQFHPLTKSFKQFVQLELT